MACFHPLEAVQLHEGAVPIVADGSHDRHIGKLLWLPCGRCIGCRLARQRAWAVRCMHEAQMHEYSSFVTLTYEDTGPSLVYGDFQKFIRSFRKVKREEFRKRVGSLNGYKSPRFFVCGEYGELGMRPHFHALIFGHYFDRDSTGHSNEVERHWRHGINYVGDVSFDSAQYVARYSCDKITGELAKSHYLRVDTRTGEYVRCRPEFGKMSLRPAIGYSWFQKYWKEVFLVRDGVVLRGGRTVPAPRYYFDLLCRLPEDAKGEVSERVVFDRYVRQAKFAEDCTPSRLEVREQCARARLNFMKESKR